MDSIIIEVDNKIKQAFEMATPETQEQLKTLIKIFFEQKSKNVLTEVMEEISDKAAERGLTEEILRNILADEE